MPDKTQLTSTSQEFLDIYDITNNVVILKNGSASVVLTVNAMNFGLLSEAEQDAVIFSYARLLNSLNYPIQIIIQSQTKDATSYLNKLEEQQKNTTDKTKQEWINRYSNFVSELIQQRNVLDKKFFVVIPATALEMGLETVQSVLPGGAKFDVTQVEKSVILEKAANLLEPKRDHLISQFGAIGLYARQLNTQEIIRLFYTNYNPEASEGQQISDSRSYTTPLVQARYQGGLMDNQNNQPNNGAPSMPTDNAAPAAQPAQDVQPAQDAQSGAQPQDAQSPAMPQPSMPSESTPPATPSAAPAGISESPEVKTPGGDDAPTSGASATTPMTPAPGMSQPSAPTMPTPSAPAQPAAPTTPTPNIDITAPSGDQVTSQPANQAAPAMPTPTPPAQATTTPASADAANTGDDESVQEAINDTLEELGGSVDAQPAAPAQPATPTTPTPSVSPDSATPTDTATSPVDASTEAGDQSN